MGLNRESDNILEILMACPNTTLTVKLDVKNHTLISILFSWKSQKIFPFINFSDELFSIAFSMNFPNSQICCNISPERLCFGQFSLMN